MIIMADYVISESMLDDNQYQTLDGLTMLNCLFQVLQDLTHCQRFFLE